MKRTVTKKLLVHIYWIQYVYCPEKVYTSWIKLLSFFAGDYQKNKFLRKFSLCFFGNICYAENVYTSSNKVIPLFVAKYCKNTVAVKIIHKFIGF